MANPAYVQSKSAVSTSGATTVSCALTNQVTPGNFLAAFFSGGDTGTATWTITSFNDTNSLATWNQISGGGRSGLYIASPTGDMASYFGIVNTTGTMQVNLGISASAGTVLDLMVLEYSNTQNATDQNTNNKNATTATTALSSFSVTSGNAVDLWLCHYIISGSGASSAPKAGWTIRENDTASNGVADFFTTSTGVNQFFTCTIPSSTYGARLFTFKGATVAAPILPHLIASSQGNASMPARSVLRPTVIRF